MNNVSLLGRLTADPELRNTQSGAEFTRFSIAVDRPVKKDEEKQADFINIVAWNKTAAFVCKYFAKGQRIALTGSIRTGSYTDRDGVKRYTFEVWADKVEFCEAKRDSVPASYAAPERTSGVPDITAEPMPGGDDLPF